MRLSDLREVREGAPPPRYGVDDVITFGRRMRRRRQTAWAAGVAIAVAAVVAIPQLTGGSEHRQPPVLEQNAPQLLPFETTFTAYAAGRFQVKDPNTVGLGHASADISGCDEVCVLTVLRPGVELPGSLDGKRVATDPISDRPAYFLDTDDGGRVLTWEYADGARAWIQTSPVGPGQKAMTRTEMRQVAEALHVGTFRPMSVGFVVAYAPAGYRLTSAQNGVEVSVLGFEETAVAEARMAAPDRITPKNLRNGHPRVEIAVVRVPSRQAQTHIEVRCEATGTDGPRCQRWLPDARTLIEASGGPADELRRAVEGVTVVDTTVPVNQAVPASAQLTVG
ncbi:hypothetical protein AB0M02_36985 [Actinoplanes sp. NPDC051861]|uniref:hypothetical protein n=1 Tax=Actinoplanes sp. NPDC051861 TaxID=3155170 RepID=UPI00342A6885